MQPDPEKGCWIWQGFRERSGYKSDCYGRLSLFGRKWYAHVVMWMLAHGARVPAGFEVDHRCRNTACVNPDHLEAVHRWVNKARRDAAQGMLALPDPTPF